VVRPPSVGVPAARHGVLRLAAWRGAARLRAGLGAPRTRVLSQCEEPREAVTDEAELARLPLAESVAQKRAPATRPAQLAERWTAPRWRNGLE